MPNIYYQHSGKISPTGIPALMGGCLLAAIALGGVYALAIHYIPLIYIDVLITIGFGAAIGMTLSKAVDIGKVRNVSVALAFTVLAGLLSVYVTWVYAILILSGYEYWALSPVEIIEIIQDIGASGLWSLRSWTPTGWGIYSFWIVEAAVIIVWPIIQVKKHLAERVFCEENGEWTDVEDIAGPFKPIQDTNSFTQAIDAGDYGPLLSLEQADQADAYSIIHFKGSTSCPSFHLFSVKNIRIEHGKDDKVEHKEQYVVKHVLSTNEINSSIRSLLKTAEEPTNRAESDEPQEAQENT